MHLPQTEVVISRGGVEIERRVVEPGAYIIGRDEDCALHIESEKISRHHARLFVSFQDWSISDLGSANGTQLGDQPVGKAAMKVWPSQIIRVGDATIELRAIAATDPSAPVMPAQQAIRRHLPPELQGARRYQIGSQIARGGMGAILDAVDVSTRRNVAMKVMLNAMDPGDVLRFIEEAQVTAQLEHPNIVPVHELSVNEQGEVFYTMKMVRGITLHKVIDLLTKGTGDVAKKYPLAALLTIFQKVCDAIAFAHSKGVIHRDLKPENIMLGDYGEVLVMDWGLARILGSKENNSDVRSAKADEGDAMRTMAGSIMGTPNYMSPEQARGEVENLDSRSDIYALGTILFELLHLRPVVTGTKVMEIVSKVQSGEVEWTTKKSSTSNRPSTIPASLLAVCRKALALSITARYPRVEDLQADLLAYQNGFATGAERAGAWKQFTLFVRRNKAASIGVAAVLLIGGTLGTKAVIEGKRAERGEALAKSEAKRALNEAVRAERGEVLAKAEAKRAEDALASLKNTAPTFAAQATGLVEQGNLEDALEKIGYAVSLDKGNADYLLQQANLLQATQQLTEAAEGYRGVLALRSDAAAKRNLELCEKLLRDNDGSAELKRESQESLVNAMGQQGRAVEAASLSNILGKGSDTAVAAIKARLKPLATLPGWNWNAILKRLPDGTFRLELADKPIVELPPLNGLPITRVDLGRTKISDLTSLKGLRLRHLSIYGTRISDLTPLAGMPLEWLRADQTKISDLTSLKGMPLADLDIAYNHDISDVSPLRGMPLNKLDLRYSSITDLRPLEGMPLHFLSLNSVPVSDLSPLAGMPIEELQLSGTKVTDIGVLRTLPLKRLNLQCSVKDLSPLADCKALERLAIFKVTTDISFLRALPNLQRLIAQTWPIDSMNGIPAAEQFWQKYDSQQAAAEARAKDLARVAAALPALGMAKGRAILVEPWGVRLAIDFLPVADINGLRALPIDALSLFETKVADLAPLRGMRLKELSFAKTAVKDVSPLLDLPILEAAMVTQGATNIGVLRQHPTLKWLGWEGDWDKDANRPKLTTAEFWARYDEQQAGQK